MAETVKVLHLKNCIARIHLPEMTEEEQKKQMERLKKATADFLMDAEIELMQKREKSSKEETA